MRSRTACLFAAAFALLLGHSALAQTPGALTGKVSSAEEGLMEGVVISAKKGIVTVSVVSNAKGEFSFPAAKLDAGTYALSIKATGYDLAGPSIGDARAGAPVNLDLKLAKTRNIAAQLTKSRMDPQRSRAPTAKASLCAASIATRSSASSIPSTTRPPCKDVIRRMATYSNNSFHLMPQMREEARDIDRFVPGTARGCGLFRQHQPAAQATDWQPKPLPRVKGSGTRVVITEYDLPDPTIQPHDVIVDPDGIVWHSDFSVSCSAASTPRR